MKRQLKESEKKIDSKRLSQMELKASSPQKQDSEQMDDIIRKYREYVSELKDQTVLNEFTIESNQ